jgi:transcriptional regulator with GAF, ATPase, and Fis domain
VPDLDGAPRDDGDGLQRLGAAASAGATDSARLAALLASQGQELERALRTMRTAMEIATAVGSDTDLDRILELIARRARALVDADGLLIWLRHGDMLRIAAVAGNADIPEDAAIPLGGSTAGETLLAGRSLRVEDAREMRVDPRSSACRRPAAR